jgi:hypothetical protein
VSDLDVVVAATTSQQLQTLTNKHEPSLEAEHFKALPPHDNNNRDWITNPKVGNVVITEKTFVYNQSDKTTHLFYSK